MGVSMKFICVLFIVMVLMMLMVGCLFPRMEPLEPLPTYTPAPPQLVVVTPTPIPESEWFCLTGQAQIISAIGPYGETKISIIGDQILCGRDWKISNVKGPVGYNEMHGDEPLTFSDLQELLDTQRKHEGRN